MLISSYTLGMGQHIVFTSLISAAQPITSPVSRPGEVTLPVSLLHFPPYPSASCYCCCLKPSLKHEGKAECHLLS